MAELVAAFGVPHTPLLWRLMGDNPPPDLKPVAERFGQVEALLAQAAPDAIIIVGSDHFHQFHHGQMPAFSIGKADRMTGTYPNEERSFGLPTIEVDGQPGLAEALLGRTQLAGGFDFAFTNRPLLDHAYVVPLLYLRPQLDIPIVPIHTNTNAPPIPTAQRFVELGRHIRATIDSYADPQRVAVIATGHLAYELGGPQQFSGKSTDPAFDEMAVGWMRSGDVVEAATTCTFERLERAGNLTYQYLNFLTLAAATGTPADHAEGIACRFGNEPFFMWGPK